MLDNDFFKAIKEKSLSGIYLLEGDEEYSKEKALKQCLSLCQEAVRDLNTQVLDNPTCSEIISAAEAAPFFDDYRIVTVLNPNMEEVSLLLDSAERIPSSTILLIRKSGGNIKENSTVFKSLNKQNRIVKFEPFDPPKAVSFLGRCAKQSHVYIDSETASCLVSMIGTDLGTLENSMAVLASYVGENSSVTKDAINKCIAPSSEYTTWNILDALLDNMPGKAIRMLQNEIKEGRQSITPFIGFVESRLKLYINAKQLMINHSPESDVLKYLNPSKPYAAKTTLGILKKKKMSYLKKALLRFSKADSDIKMKGITDYNAVMLAIFECFKED